MRWAQCKCFFYPIIPKITFFPHFRPSFSSVIAAVVSIGNGSARTGNLNFGFSKTQHSFKWKKFESSSANQAWKIIPTTQVDIAWYFLCFCMQPNNLWIILSDSYKTFNACCLFASIFSTFLWWILQNLVGFHTCAHKKFICMCALMQRTKFKCIFHWGIL